jgi:hypothetical protein
VYIRSPAGRPQVSLRRGPACAFVGVSDVPGRIHIAVPQEWMSAEWNRYVVHFLAESDPIGVVDVRGKSSSAAGRAFYQRTDGLSHDHIERVQTTVDGI